MLNIKLQKMWVIGWDRIHEEPVTHLVGPAGYWILRFAMAQTLSANG